MKTLHASGALRLSLAFSSVPSVILVLLGINAFEGENMNTETVSRFIEYIEEMILLCEDGEYVTDSRGCYPKDEYLKRIAAEAKELIKYGEAEIALENMLENLNEVSIGINKEAAQLLKQAFGEEYSNRVKRLIKILDE